MVDGPSKTPDSSLRSLQKSEIAAFSGRATVRLGAVLLGWILLAAAASGAPLREICTSGGGRIRTLDPAFADDLASRNLICAVYDTLLEYDYDARPYKLKP